MCWPLWTSDDRSFFFYNLLCSNTMTFGKWIKKVFRLWLCEVQVPVGHQSINFRSRFSWTFSCTIDRSPLPALRSQQEESPLIYRPRSLIQNSLFDWFSDWFSACSSDWLHVHSPFSASLPQPLTCSWWMQQHAPLTLTAAAEPELEHCDSEQKNKHPTETDPQLHNSPGCSALLSPLTITLFSIWTKEFKKKENKTTTTN